MYKMYKNNYNYILVSLFIFKMFIARSLTVFGSVQLLLMSTQFWYNTIMNIRPHLQTHSTTVCPLRRVLLLAMFVYDTDMLKQGRMYVAFTQNN